MADAAAGVGDVAGVARDDMEVKLRHGLAGSGAVVETEVESVGRRAEVRSQVLLRPINPDQEPCLVGAGQVLETGHRPAGNDEGVAWGDWEFVGDDSEEVIEGQDA